MVLLLYFYWLGVKYDTFWQISWDSATVSSYGQTNIKQIYIHRDSEVAISQSVPFETAFQYEL